MCFAGNGGRSWWCWRGPMSATCTFPYEIRGEGLVLQWRGWHDLALGRLARAPLES